MNERVEVATINVHAFATIGSVHDLAAIMHQLSQFPDVCVTTRETDPGVLVYLVETPEEVAA